MVLRRTMVLRSKSDQQPILKAEADRVLQYAMQYVETVRKEQEKAAEEQAAKVKKQKEQEVVARKLLDEFSALVVRAEAAGEMVNKTAAPLETTTDNVTILRMVAAVEKASQAAIETCTDCDSFCEQNAAVTLEAETIRKESEKTLEVLKARALQAAKQTALDVQKAFQHRGKVVKSIEQPLFSKRWEALFKAYDEDDDGYLNRKEAAAYAKGEFSFDIPSASIDRIFGQLVKDKPGVALDQCQRLRTAVGIAIHEDRGRTQQTKEQGTKDES